ncbi:MAG: biotin-dependent carboxyltransferase family protein [Clostridiales bacterium]|nr:biotin-dependent carboxyltransferase family protein [Clostridiales bacterium]
MNMKNISPGALTTVQDLGRYGYMQFGFSASGAMDARSARIANLLADNDERDGVLEMTMLGIKADFDEDCVIALAGADMKPELNGESVPMYAALEVKAGDVLSLSPASGGLRCYMAVSGGFDIPLVMGSFSTNLKCAVGGFCGRALRAGDILGFRNERKTLFGIASRRLNEEDIPAGSDEIRVVAGPQDDYFTGEGSDTFFSEAYTLSNASDRMGLRLEGKSIAAKEKSDIISDGIALGSVQIPASGKPIIMMADRQTTGGYAKIATVISADISVLAQKRPGDVIRFKQVSIKEAQKIYKAQERFFRNLALSLMRV